MACQIVFYKCSAVFMSRSRLFRKDNITFQILIYRESSSFTWEIEHIIGCLQRKVAKANNHNIITLLVLSRETES